MSDAEAYGPSEMDIIEVLVKINRQLPREPDAERGVPFEDLPPERRMQHLQIAATEWESLKAAVVVVMQAEAVLAEADRARGGAA